MRDNIKKAMAEIRKNKILARMNHLCCSSCAGYDLTEKIDEMPVKKAKEMKGIVYWHRQDEDSYKNSGVLYIRYQGIDTAKYPNRDKKTGWTTIMIGHIVADAMKKYGVPFKWSGNPDKCIIVADNEDLLKNVSAE